ncbi:MAG TPA: YARHG domain-containing protein [Chthoniobacterales bacterium]|jgi:hypothetical protein|nr:YARHG domain-containing protein [Chthoniobacterales bacterium]
MKAGTKFTWGLILALGGKILFVVGIALSFSIIGACLGLPMAAVGFPLIIWGYVWLYKARADKAREVIARGIREGLSQYELPPVARAPGGNPPLPAPELQRGPENETRPRSPGGIPANADSVLPVMPVMRQSATRRKEREWPKHVSASIWTIAESIKDGLVVTVQFLSQRKAAPVALAVALMVMTLVAAVLGVMLYQQSRDSGPAVVTPREEVNHRPNPSSSSAAPRTVATTVVNRAPVPPQATPSAIPASKPDYRREAIARAEDLWREAWIPFGDTWVARAEVSPYLVQIRNRRIEAESRTLNEADRLNGVEWEGTVAFYRSAERRFAFESSAGGVRLDPYRVGWNEWRSPNAGAISVYRLKRQNGRWSGLEHDIATGAKLEWGRDEMVRPKKSELHLAGLNGDAPSEIPASTPVTSTRIADTNSSSPAISPGPITVTNDPPGLTGGRNDSAAQQSPPLTAQWPGEQFPETRSRALSAAELQEWSADRLQYAINEMFARRGADFGDQRVARWFQQFSWYHPIRHLSFDQIEAAMPQVEYENLKVLGNARDAKRAMAPAATASARVNSPPRVNPNFPPDPVGQMIGRFFQSVRENAKQAPRRSPTPAKKRTR